jgi:hypothetical protein
MYNHSKIEHFIGFFKCTITLNDIDPKLVDEYMKYKQSREKIIHTVPQKVLKKSKK